MDDLVNSSTSDWCLCSISSASWCNLAFIRVDKSLSATQIFGQQWLMILNSIVMLYRNISSDFFCSSLYADLSVYKTSNIRRYYHENCFNNSLPNRNRRTFNYLHESNLTTHRCPHSSFCFFTYSSFALYNEVNLTTTSLLTFVFIQ